MQPPPFVDLPVEQPRQAQQQFSRALGQRQCQRGIGRHPDHRSQQHVAAFLHAQRAGNQEGDATDSLT